MLFQKQICQIVIHIGFIYKTICSKSDVWSYEKEWRIVTANFEEMGLKNLEGKYVFDLKQI